MDLVIKNGTVVTPSDVCQADVGITDGRIAQIADHIPEEGRVIDAKGCYVCPGGVDIHTHIDSVLHGMRTVDDWYYASLGAAAGGTTTVVDFPLQPAGQSLRATIEERIEAASKLSLVDFAFAPIVTQFTDDTYAEIPGLIRDGHTSFKTFMYYDWKIDDYNLARLLDVVGSNGGIVGIHCENAGTIDYLGAKAIAEGRTGPEWHAPTRPVSTETEASARVLAAAAELQVPVWIVHMSAGPAVRELARARAEGVCAYGETMLHFLCLDESYYARPGLEPLKAVVTPPLRPASHQEMLWDGLRCGTLSTVGSDHCAFPYKDKIRLYETRGKKFNMIPHGAPGIETRLPMLFAEGVSEGRISVSKFVEVIAANPARLAGIYPQKGALMPGSDADIVIIDPDRKVTMGTAMLHGKTDYTLFEGWELQGYPVATLSRGTVLFENGELVAERGRGQALKRGPFIPF